MRTYIASSISALALTACMARPAAATLVQDTVNVSGKAGPWIYQAGGLNSSYPYAQDSPLGIGTPVVVDSSKGFDFTAGNIITIAYVSGTVSANNSSFPYTDANGDTTKVRENSTQVSGGYIPPAQYMTSDQYPVYMCTAVGVFADSTGAIVGTPFKIGDSASLVVPAGAAQLNIGANDTYLPDNRGSWDMQVSENVPEPTAGCLLLIGGLLLLSRRAMRHKRAL